jgi:O-antigen/teichoic acid export membrane protein
MGPSSAPEKSTSFYEDRLRHVKGRLGALLGRFLGASGPLVLGRIASAGITFALPLLLVRLLRPSEFGTYKQFFLVAQTLLLVGQLGLNQSIFFFLPRGERGRGAYIGGALICLLLMGLLLGLGALVGAPRIGHYLGDGGLASLGPPLGAYVALMLLATPIEGALMSERRIGQAGLAYLLSDATRAATLAGAAAFFSGRALFYGAAGFAALRVAALFAILSWKLVPVERPRRATLIPQLTFALPLAGASLLYVAQRYFSQYAISARFDASTFALYAVASFHLPVVDIVYSPMSDVMAVGVAGARSPEEARHHFRDTVERLATLLFPALVAAFLVGSLLIPTFFTHRYDRAVPLFFLATLEVPCWIFPLDSLMRSLGHKRFLLLFNLARVGLTAIAVVGGIRFFGLRGAILGGVISETISRAYMLHRGAQALGTSVRQLLDWPRLGRLFGAALLSAIPALCLRACPLHPGGRLLLALAGFFCSYLWLTSRRPPFETPALQPVEAAR